MMTRVVMTRVIRPSLILLSATAALALCGTVLSTSSETLLRSSFASALSPEAPARTGTEVAKAPPVAGSEDFWLSGMAAALRPVGHGPIAKGVAVGDKITLTFGGTKRTLLISAVEDVGVSMTQVDTAQAPSRVVMITAREAKDGASPVRFMMEIAGEPAPVLTKRTGRTS